MSTQSQTTEKVMESQSPMEHIIPYYFDKFKEMYHDENEQNTLLYWIKVKLEEKPKKSESKAIQYRTKGNELYLKGKFKDSLTCYNTSLSHAIFNGIEYGKALANRSAVLLALQEYQKCLKDIERCIQSEYPPALRCKLVLRKLTCYYNLNMASEFKKCVDENIETLMDKCSSEYDLLVNKFNGNMKLGLNPLPSEEYSAPSLQMNETFAYATNLVKLCYSKKMGRYVVAAKDIKPGDILFREKAFVALPIMPRRGMYVSNTCYHCLLKTELNGIPCESCTYCFYCSEACKQFSWASSHQFECRGITIWYDLGEVHPAFQILVKGVASGFTSKDERSTTFGAYVDNYPYVNSLIFDFEDHHKQKQLLTSSAIVVLYLKNYTDFFQYVGKRYIFQHTPNDVFFGAMLVRHMAQMTLNGFCTPRGTSGTGNDPIGVALYPSLSMMNHSCRISISICYHGDIAEVTATDYIKRGEQVFNNYGVGFLTPKEERKAYLKTMYRFDCTCPDCIDPEPDEDDASTASTQ